MEKVTWLKLVLTALAVYRLSMLLVVDTITEPWRQWLSRTFTPDSSLVTLFFCNWCLSVWIGAAVTLLVYFFWPVMAWVCLALAASAFAGFMSEHS